MPFHPSLGFLNIQESLSGYGSPFTAYKHIGTGAFLFLVAHRFWMTRRQWQSVFSSVQRDNTPLLFRDERWTMPALLVGLGLMISWLWLSGLSLLPLFVFLVTVWAFFIGLTRIVAESGLGEAVAPSIAPDMTVSTLGARLVGRKGLAALALTFVWCSDIRTFPLAAAVHGLKIADELSFNNYPLFAGMMSATIVTIVTAVTTNMILAYHRGGINLNNWFFIGAPPLPYRFAERQAAEMRGPFVPGLWLKGFGFVLLALLTQIHRQSPWLPFHPIGFSVATIWLMNAIWLNAFLAWIIKGTLLRYGGARAYATFRPFFLGLILGQFTTNALWLLIDFFTGKTGNVVFWI